jgi:hypothetical protein
LSEPSNSSSSSSLSPTRPNASIPFQDRPDQHLTPTHIGHQQPPFFLNGLPFPFPIGGKFPTPISPTAPDNGSSALTQQHRLMLAALAMQQQQMQNEQHQKPPMPLSIPPVNLFAMFQQQQRQQMNALAAHIQHQAHQGGILQIPPGFGNNMTPNRGALTGPLFNGELLSVGKANFWKSEVLKYDIKSYKCCDIVILTLSSSHVTLICRRIRH